MMEHHPEMAKILQEMADKPLTERARTTHQDKIVELLRFFSAKGRTLEFCCGRQFLDRQPSTLKKYCRDNDIGFSDYTPMAMKKKDAKTTETAENSEE